MGGRVFAKSKGLGEKAEETLFYAYFTLGKNLSDNMTLIELGKEIGLTETDVIEALANPLYLQKIENDSSEAHILGVRGVPFLSWTANMPSQERNSQVKFCKRWKKRLPNGRKKILNNNRGHTG